MHYKFTVQRVNEASFFEVTELREVARTSVGFIMFRLAQVVRQYPAQCFGKIPGFNLSKLSRLSGVFPSSVGHFFKRAREHEVKLHHVVYEVWLVSYLFFSFQIWYFWKWIITSIGQSKHMRVTRFNPLWVSGFKQRITGKFLLFKLLPLTLPSYIFVDIKQYCVCTCTSLLLYPKTSLTTSHKCIGRRPTTGTSLLQTDDCPNTTRSCAASNCYNKYNPIMSLSVTHGEGLT